MTDCIVIGAGLAGLCAARELRRRGQEVVLLEARKRVGGRVENIFLEEGQIVEMGGQWVNPGHQQLLDELIASGHEMVRSTPGDMLIRIDGQVTRLHSNEDGSTRYSPFDIADLGQGLLRFTRLAQRLENDPKWVADNAEWLDQATVRWISSNLRTKGGQAAFVEAFAESMPAGMAAPGKLRDALAWVRVGINLESLVVGRGGIRQVRVLGGMFAFCEELAAEIGGSLRLGTEVTAIRQDDDQVYVTTAQGEELIAPHAIVTLPPWLELGLEWTPAQPDWRVKVAGRIAPAPMIKACVVYPSPWWKDDGLSGQMGADEGAVRVTFDTSDPGAGGYGVLMGFLEDVDGRLHEAAIEERERAFVAALVATFGARAAHPIAYRDRDWLAEEFTKGSNGAHFMPGEWSLTGPLLAQPYGRVHFAGAEYATRSNGYLEGAMRSGIETALEVARDH